MPGNIVCCAFSLVAAIALAIMHWHRKMAHAWLLFAVAFGYLVWESATSSASIDSDASIGLVMLAVAMLAALIICGEERRRPRHGGPPC